MKTINYRQAIVWTTGKGCVLIVSIFALWPFLAEADCLNWSAGGNWTLTQDNGYVVSLKLHQNRSAITGTASYVSGKAVVHGSVEGTMIERHEGREPAFGASSSDWNVYARSRLPNSLKMTISWDNSTTGIYRGTVGSGGRIEGETFDKNNTSSRAHWSSNRVVCR